MTLAERRKFIIIGGGIAGLCSAIALRRQGIEANVFEAAPQLKEAGAGLGVGANALQAMRLLGLEEKLLRRSLILTGITLTDDRGRRITHTDSTPGNASRNPDNLTIHRAELLHLLAESLPPGAIKTEKRFMKYTRLADGGIKAWFEDGSTAEGAGLIAADGIRSSVRQSLLPDAEPRYSGYTCWRAVADVPAGLVPPVFRALWGPKGRFGYAPLPDNRVYWFAVINSPPRNPAFAGMGIPELRKRYASYPQPVEELLERTEAAAVLHNDIYDLKPLDRFAFGNVVLVGDAAHATTPNLAQGAAQAMEDAIILAKCLAAEPVSVEEAFRRFEQQRLARTSRVVSLSRRLGRAAQLESALLCGIRNRLLRAMPSWVSDRQLRFLRDIPF